MKLKHFMKILHQCICDEPMKLGTASIYFSFQIWDLHSLQDYSIQHQGYQRKRKANYKIHTCNPLHLTLSPKISIFTRIKFCKSYPQKVVLNIILFSTPFSASKHSFHKQELKYSIRLNSAQTIVNPSTIKFHLISLSNS